VNAGRQQATNFRRPSLSFPTRPTPSSNQYPEQFFLFIRYKSSTLAPPTSEEWQPGRKKNDYQRFRERTKILENPLLIEFCAEQDMEAVDGMVISPVEFRPQRRSYVE